MKINAELHREMDYTCAGLDMFYCYYYCIELSRTNFVIPTLLSFSNLIRYDYIIYGPLFCR